MITVLTLPLALLMVAPLPGEPQEPGRIPRIGVLGASSGDPLVEALRQGLRERGYVEGQNIRIEYRSAEGRNERLPGLAAELVSLKVDIIVATSQGAVAAREATNTIPIVMPIVTDPVRLGLIASLAKPGRNATGLATQNDELPGKWLELVKEALPSVARVAILIHPSYDGGVQLNASQSAARTLGVVLQVLNVARSPEPTASADRCPEEPGKRWIVIGSSARRWVPPKGRGRCTDQLAALVARTQAAKPRRAIGGAQGETLMLRPKALDHVGLTVTDMDQTLQCYERLGLTTLRTSGPNADGERSAVMRVGSQELNVFSHPGVVSSGTDNPVGMDHFCLVVDAGSIDDVIADLGQAGIEIVEGPEERRDGAAVFVHDPDGVRVELQLKTSAAR